MKTDYMVIGRIRNAENITKLIQGIRSKGYTCYNFLDQPATPDRPDLPWAEQMEILESYEDFWNDPVYVNHFRRLWSEQKNRSDWRS